MLFKIIIVVVLIAAVFTLLGILGWRKAWYPTPAKAITGKKIIACVGDSITFGAGVKNQKKDSYPVRLQALVPQEYQVINYGMSGRTATLAADWPYVREKNYRVTFGVKPDCYICMLGSNDAKPYNFTLEDYEHDYRAFLQRYVNVAGADRVYVMLPPKTFVLEGETEVMFDILDENVTAELSILRKIAAELQIHTIDLNTYTQGHPEWFKDGVHPNEEGNIKIAEYINSQLQL